MAKVDVLYMDRQVVAAVKPTNRITQEDFDEDVKAYIREVEGRENPFLEVIHRIDRPVSGIVLFARSSKSLSRMQEEMRSRRCQKGYIAYVEGKVKDDEGTLVHSLLKGDFKTHIHPEGKEAILKYKVIRREPGRTLLLIALYTGRYHQIRAQLAHIGHPIIGDHKYGAQGSGVSILLHHTRITITHPITKEVMVFVSPPPFLSEMIQDSWLTWFANA